MLNIKKKKSNQLLYLESIERSIISKIANSDEKDVLRINFEKGDEDEKKTKKLFEESYYSQMKNFISRLGMFTVIHQI